MDRNNLQKLYKKNSHSMKSKEYYEIENREWLDSLEYVIENDDPERVREIVIAAAV